MSSIPIQNLNRKIKEGEPLLEAINSDELTKGLKDFEINWKKGTINRQSWLYGLFVDQGFIHPNENYLTTAGLLFFSRSTIDFNFEFNRLDNLLDQKYKIIRPIQIGKNSLAYLAKHKTLGFEVVLKVIRPGASENISEALQVIINNDTPSQLVKPQDFFSIAIHDIFENEVEIECLVFPYVSGVSLKEFLANDKQPMNSHAIASFIRQISEVLAYLELLNAYHGDLHNQNILVQSSDSGEISFHVIDVSFGINGSLDTDECKDTDLAYFRQHIWSFLRTQQKFLKKMSIMKYLGAQLFHVVSEIMTKSNITFLEIKNLFTNNPSYDKYKNKKEQFVREKFRIPESFKLQRYEEITDQKAALHMFEPFPELMDKVSGFGNVIITGNRGSGKSTYLAAMAFFPKVDEPLYPFRETFGIYFPCRQGEFRLLSSEMVDYSKLGYKKVKHVFAIKIVRRTLETIAEAIQLDKINEPSDFSQIKEVLSVFLEKGELFALDRQVVSEIDNLVSMMIRIEMKEIDNLFNSEGTQLTKKYASEREILLFFKAIQRSFFELSSTKFHLLFDDAGSPNMPSESQRILNDLIVSSNPLYCIKLTAEVYSYEFKTTSGKVLENGHDYYEYDIYNVFFTGSKTVGLQQEVLEDHFKKIVARRLKYFGYHTENIEDYVGLEKSASDLLVGLLATGARDAYYHGWSIICKVADRNPRNLLELISEIFSAANVDESTEPEIIKRRIQNRGIKSVSEKRLRSIGQISGVIEFNGRKISLGQRLYDITAGLGAIYRIYLKSAPNKRRKDQYLAIERNDTAMLEDIVQQILKELIRYGILDTSRLDFARDDMVKKPIYVLNRIYCPAFGIGLRRDQHLRLSRAKFELLFIDPRAFIATGTRRLRKYGGNYVINTQQNLFDQLPYEKL